jgi:hypothetical protein
MAAGRSVMISDIDTSFGLDLNSQVLIQTRGKGKDIVEVSGSFVQSRVYPVTGVWLI